MNTLAMKTHVAVQTACWELGISDDVAIWSIIQYEERNRAFHGDLDSLKAEGKFRKLALVLYTDFEDIDWVFSDLRSDTDKHSLKTIIRDEIDHEVCQY